MGEIMQSNEIRTVPSVSVNNKRRSRPGLHEDQGGRGQVFDDGIEGYGGASDDIVLDSIFLMENSSPVSLVLSSTSLMWDVLQEHRDVGLTWCCGFLGADDLSKKIEINEIYAVETFEAGDTDLGGKVESTTYERLPSNQMHNLLVVHSYEKASNQNATWTPKCYVFQHANFVICKEWAAQIQLLIDVDTNRPKNLLVVVNPHSGKKKALKTWEEVAYLFTLAKINIMVLKTERSNHAFDMMNNLSDEYLERLDGVVVVGGDGIFNEVLNGLLVRHHKARYPAKPEDLSKANINHDCIKICSIKRRDDKTALWSKKPITDRVVAALPDMMDLQPFLEHLITQNPGLSDFDTYSDRGFLSELEGHKNKSQQLAEIDFPSSQSIDHGHSLDTVEFKDGGFIVRLSHGQSMFSNDGNGTSVEDSKHRQFEFPNSKLRFGIIPAGSTDSIAVSTTGSRNPATCALHIILGERMPLDVLRLVSWKIASTDMAELPRVRYAASFAGYGFYGDVMKESEPSRWMGPLRYDYAGTRVFLQHKTYEAEVSYIELPENKNKEPHKETSLQPTMVNKGLKRAVCQANCGVCAKGRDYSDIDQEPDPSSTLHEGPKWKNSKGFFTSIGAAVISCRNGKAPNGIAASAHLADGLLHLILVKECSRVAHLWHLIQLTRENTDPLDFAFVEAIKTPCFNFVSRGEESIWNVDGELFPAHQLSAQVFRGLINIFASGPDV